MASLLITIDAWTSPNHHCFSHNINWVFKGFTHGAITPNYSLQWSQSGVLFPSYSTGKQDVSNWFSRNFVDRVVTNEEVNKTLIIPVGQKGGVAMSTASYNEAYSWKPIFMCLSADTWRCKTWFTHNTKTLKCLLKGEVKCHKTLQQ